MTTAENLDKIAINAKSHTLLRTLLLENPELERVMHMAHNETEALIGVREWVMGLLRDRPEALRYYEGVDTRREDFEALQWSDYAAIRLLDYIDNAGREFPDLNLRGELAVSNPLKTVWLAVAYGTGGAKPAFFEDTIQLFRQLSGKSELSRPSLIQVQKWMDRWPTGLDPRIIRLREENQDRILKIFIKKIDAGEITRSAYQFEEGMTLEEKLARAREWWKTSSFHLKFAVRDPDVLNEMLGGSLDPDVLKVLKTAKEAGIPFFVNPYYLSLLHVRVPYFAVGADLAIRDYVLYSPQLVDEFGEIVAWEKEDKVEPGKPNAAGWILPTATNIHRRYPEVAILIPDSMGRACGGLCSSCQRMYDFQRGNLNFDLDKLKPKETWAEKLKKLMLYFEEDSQLRDILITGGDALMSSDRILNDILDAVYEMAKRKQKANKKRPAGKKLAELVRVRLGTRLPVYLPQRMTPELIKILRDFKEKSAKIGIKQFVIQTHFESPMEITPEVKEGVRLLLSAGWIVTNQHVFTAASSRRGHTARLREVMGEIGILPYYTFSVKGYMENWHNFATNARAVQEQFEEKAFGHPDAEVTRRLVELVEEPEELIEELARLQKDSGLPFIASDRNVLNLPGVGKSLTFRVIGITRYGRRILEFDHDATRIHSPIIEKMGKVVIIESKSLSEYLEQLEDMGEDRSDYESIYGYSMGSTEERSSIYEYPPQDSEITSELTNLEL